MSVLTVATDPAVGELDDRLAKLREFARPGGTAGLSAASVRGLVLAAQDIEREARVLRGRFEAAEHEARTGEPF